MSEIPFDFQSAPKASQIQITLIRVDKISGENTKQFQPKRWKIKASICID